MANIGPFHKFVAGDAHKKVPRDPVRNLDYREKLHKICASDIEAQRSITELARSDFLFWLNSFCWVFEPRWSASYPFASWEFQDEAFYEIFSNIGVKDVGIEKSRDMGATWMVIAAFVYLFLYQDRATFGLVSRTEDVVLDKSDPDTLFWKVKYLIEGLPSWLTPRVETSKRNFTNLDTGGVITGYSATGDIARGGRRLAFMMDELAAFNPKDGYDAWASTMAVTDSRIAVSTPKGDAGIFADLMNRPQRERSLKKIRLHWTLHPRKRYGLYTTEKGKLKILDATAKFPADYKYKLDGKLRSIWYDNECLRHPSPVFVAQEVDIDYGRSGNPFFDLDMISGLIVKYGRPPMTKFQLDWDNETGKVNFHENENGNFAVWYAGVKERWAPDRGHDYCFGVDVATGRGGSYSTNSVISIINAATGEKMAEFADPNVEPSDLAYLVAGLRAVFSGPTGIAWLAWEANGPGGNFGKKITEISPGRVYMRRQLKRFVEKRTQEPGWWSNPETKRILLGDYQDALRHSKFINHSEVALDECRHYVFGSNGDIQHDKAMAEMETSSAGMNHGDRVIADAVAWRMKRAIFTKNVAPAARINVNETNMQTLAGRMAHWKRQSAQARKEYW